MPIAFEIKGLQETLAKFAALPAVVKQEVDDELTATAYNIADQAKMLAPVDLGNLKNRIDVTQNDPLMKRVSSQAEYSSYVEFGTGTGVSFWQGVPGLPEYAIQFKGLGKEGKHPVRIKGRWVMVPYQLNLHARPFFFPAVQAQTLDLAKRLKAIIETNAGK